MARIFTKDILLNPDLLRARGEIYDQERDAENLNTKAWTTGWGAFLHDAPMAFVDKWSDPAQKAYEAQELQKQRQDIIDKMRFSKLPSTGNKSSADIQTELDKIQEQLNGLGYVG